MATGDGPPLSMRPFPVADKSPKNLADFIARVNALPGGFRAVTEAGLEGEIDVRPEVDGEDGAQDVDMTGGPLNNNDEDDDGDNDNEGDNDDDEDDDAKDPQAARMEVLKNIDIASNTAMLTLDSLSLLLSKQNPTQAGLTLSPQLREMVGIGTMGADRLDDANTTPAKTQDREAVAIGWTLMEIDRTRDAAEEATAFLAAEMAAEGRYWEGVMAVRQAGWSVCRVPQERSTSGALGVRFGFSEAAPDFQRNGLAPLRRADDGVARLDIGRLGGTQERLVVTYESGGKVVGRAAPRELDGGNDDDDGDGDGDGSLEARVLGARNTIFAQELWHELTREARSLAAYDVRTDEEKRLVCAVDADSRIIVELLPVAACQRQQQQAPPDEQAEELPDNATAEAISLALHILLTYAHRCNELMRIRPLPPHVPRTRGQQIYTLLRPVVARLMYARNAAACTRLVGGLVRSLRAAGVAAAAFTLRTPQPTVADLAPAGTPNQPSAAVGLVRTMLQPTDFALDVVLLPGVDFSVRGRTYLVPVTATYYHVLAPADAALHALCGPYADGYPDLEALADYLSVAAARALAAHHLGRLRAAAGEEAWALGVQGTRIRHTQDLDRPQLDFAVARGAGDEAALQLTVSRVPGGTTTAAGDVAALPQAAAPGQSSWTWTPSPEDSAKDTLEAVVDSVLKK
ncbi:hypothetical protein V2A60_004397 [Cordyceps javanica]|uniref:Mediator of RNA polymerase II transcription subunit 17 n=1 Tax=Cordyceps javanica TaxID=43265 RepID=A0A545VR21_9HYPO|nr:RNA polymerase II mediator complex component SRB4 [Cordyceps javanica]TQW04115.1 RNA polymerase II mediator complex component SRB4 [Cordyceps javanica]